jgi:hypothetical protein
MQKNRKVAPDRNEPPLQHLFGCCTHYNPISISMWQTEQGIAYSAADDIGL